MIYMVLTLISYNKNVDELLSADPLKARVADQLPKNFKALTSNLSFTIWNKMKTSDIETELKNYKIR